MNTVGYVPDYLQACILCNAGYVHIQLWCKKKNSIIAKG